MNDHVIQKVESFFARYPAKHFAAKEQLVAAYEEPRGVFYLANGQVRQYDITEQGTEVVVNIFKAHAFFPMSWAINRMPNRYFFDAASSVNVRLAPAQDVLEFIRTNEDVLYDLLARVYSGVEGLQRRMAHLMGGTARTLLLFELITESKRFGNLQPDGSCRLTLHEDELARRVGLTRETVSRELAELKQAGFVTVDHRGIVIRYLKRLESELGDVV